MLNKLDDQIIKGLVAHFPDLVNLILKGLNPVNILGDVFGGK